MRRRSSSQSEPSPAQKARYDAAMLECVLSCLGPFVWLTCPCLVEVGVRVCSFFRFEKAMEKMSKSVRRSAVQTITEDERLRQNAREVLVHIARARVAAHGGAAISLARTDPVTATAETRTGLAKAKP